MSLFFLLNLGGLLITNQGCFAGRILQSNLERFKEALLVTPNVNDKDRLGGTILHRYVSFYEQVKIDATTIIMLLIKAGIDVNAKKNKIDKQQTALHIAAEKGSFPICKLLLDNGALLDAQDKYGNTPLWLATMDYSSRQAMNREAKGEVIELLLARGSNPNLANDSSFSPLDLANTLNGTDVKKYFKTKVK